MRVLLVTHYFAEQGGGIERVAALLAKQLERQEVSISWVASKTRPLQESLLCATKCIPVSAWDGIQQATGAPWPVWGPSAIRTLWREVAQASVVHLHDCLYMGNIAAFLMARIMGRPVVVTQHVSDIPFKSRLLKAALWLAYQTAGRLVLGGAEQVIFISEQVQHDLSGRFSFQRPPRFIPNGVDTALFVPASDENREKLREDLFGTFSSNPVFIFVGRFVEKKGLSVVRRLAVAMPQHLFVLLGQGPVCPESWKLDNVSVAGSLSQMDLARYYQAADLLVLPSVGEGLPLVVQEAMSAGLPAAVSSRTARADSAVTHLLHHEACTDELKEDEVVSRWINLLKSLELGGNEAIDRRMALRRMAVDRWSWKQCAAAYVDIFRVACR